MTNYDSSFKQKTEDMRDKGMAKLFFFGTEGRAKLNYDIERLW